MAQVVLVRPIYNTHIITPPIGLGYLSAYLKRQGIDVKIIDALKDGLNRETLVDRIVAERPEAVGITCMTSYYNEVVALSRALKAEGVRVVLGGVHPTVLPESTLKDSHCDFVILGESEIALTKLVLSGFQANGIQGVYTLDTMGAYDGSNLSKAETVHDLDLIPFPDWPHMPPASYPKAPHGAIAKRYPIGVIVTSRGCPYECTFCASPMLCGRKIRFRSPANVVAEIRYLVEAFGVKEIHFEDDNLTLKRDHIAEICQLLIDQKIKISWACPNGIRADRVDETLIALMRKSGCYYFAYGIESANPVILKNIKKRESIETISRSIEMASKAGIACQGFFIFGLPGETPETIEETIRYACSSKLSRAQFLILDVLPGSELWDALGGQFNPNWAKESYREPEWLPIELTEEDLLSAQSRAFRKFYLQNPLRLLSLAASIRPGQLKYLVKRVFDYRLFASLRSNRLKTACPPRSIPQSLPQPQGLVRRTRQPKSPQSQENVPFDISVL